MAYELRIDGRSCGRWDTPEAAEQAAREAVQARPNCEPEVIDTATGQPYSPAASEAWRDDLANKIGY